MTFAAFLMFGREQMIEQNSLSRGVDKFCHDWGSKYLATAVKKPVERVHLWWRGRAQPRQLLQHRVEREPRCGDRRFARRGSARQHQINLFIVKPYRSTMMRRPAACCCGVPDCMTLIISSGRLYRKRRFGVTAFGHFGLTSFNTFSTAVIFRIDQRRDFDGLCRPGPTRRDIVSAEKPRVSDQP